MIVKVDNIKVHDSNLDYGLISRSLIMPRKKALVIASMEEMDLTVNWLLKEASVDLLIHRCCNL